MAITRPSLAIVIALFTAIHTSTATLIPRETICGVSSAELTVAGQYMNRINMCKGNDLCITKIWEESLDFLEKNYPGAKLAPPGVAGAGLKISKEFVKQFYLSIGKTPAQAGALARWNGANFGSQAFAMVGPALEFYCADNYVEGACAAGGSYFGAALSTSACFVGLGWASLPAGGTGALACFGAGVGGAKAGSWASKTACASAMKLFGEDC